MRMSRNPFYPMRPRMPSSRYSGNAATTYRGKTSSGRPPTSKGFTGLTINVTPSNRIGWRKARMARSDGTRWVLLDDVVGN